MHKREKKNASTMGGASVNQAGGLESTNQKAHQKDTTDLKILKSRSTAIEIQLQKLLALLRQGPKTTVELRRNGIMMPAARVHQLRHQQNCNITTELVSLYDPEGILHQNCARYHLLDLTAGA
jgi:hypothetical protein